MIAGPVLFADIGTLIQIGLVLLFILGPFVARLLMAGGQRQRPAQPRGGAGQGGGEIEAEIDDFLRQVGRQRGDRPPGRMENIQSPQRRANPPPRYVSGQPVDAEIIEAEPAFESSVSEHVAEQINTSVFDRRADALGDHVEEADDDMASHLHQVFDHEIGGLVDTSLPAAETETGAVQGESAVSQKKATALAAAGIAAMFRSPSSVRQAIILKEILDRPESRW